MITTALAIYVLFGLLAFAGRAWIQYRRTGDHGFRGWSGPIASFEGAAGILLALGAVAGLAALMGGRSGAFSLEVTPAPSMRLAGLGLMVLGAALTLVAQIQMGSSWRVGVRRDEATALVTTGLFRWVRNPIFTAMLMVLIGVVLIVPSVVSLFAVLAALTGIELQVRMVEEPHLVRIHGEGFITYARRVGRFVPGIGYTVRRSLERR